MQIDPKFRELLRSMRRAHFVVRAGTWRAEALDRVWLDADERYRRRTVLTGERGTSFLLDLARPTALHHGDGLLLDNEEVVGVVAKPESLVEIAAPNTTALVRLAWHLGNRHTEAEIAGDGLRIRRNPVLEEMLAGLGARLTPIEAPFEPERGAYAHQKRG